MTETQTAVAPGTLAPGSDGEGLRRLLGAHGRETGDDAPDVPDRTWPGG